MVFTDTGKMAILDTFNVAVAESDMRLDDFKEEYLVNRTYSDAPDIDMVAAAVAGKLSSRFDWVAFGASKMVCGTDDENDDYVVKVPIEVEEWHKGSFGGYARCGDYIVRGRKPNSIESIGAFLNFGSDYCAAEAYISAAVEEYYPKAAPLFALTEYCGELFEHGVTVRVYASERADLCRLYDNQDEWGAQQVSKKSSERASKLLSDDYQRYPDSMPTDILARFYDDWGVEATESMLDAITEYGLNDFNSGNFGVDVDGCIRLTDYSGFND